MALRHYNKRSEIAKTRVKEGKRFRLLSTHDKARTAKAAMIKAKGKGYNVRGFKVTIGKKNQVIWALYGRKK